MTPRKPSLEEFAVGDSAARFEENAAVRRELNAIRAAYGSLRAEHERLAETHAALERIYSESLVLEAQPDWLKPAKASKADEHRATLVAVLSDLHAGEVVDPEQMGGYNAYNLDICDRRLARFFDKTMALARDYLAGVTYDGIVLVLGGDLVSGDIHDELAQTNELSVLDTTLWVAPRLVAGIERWAEEFGKVHVVSAPGNHGRDSKRPRHKGRSAHNADTHIAKMAAMAIGTEGITFEVPESFDAAFEVYGHRFSVEHGDNLRFSGTAEIGALGPIKRGTLRKARASSEEGRPFDTLLVGHFHQLIYAPSQGFVANGTPKGWDEYAKAWAFKPEPPQQALFVVSPENGPTAHMPVLVMDRKAEGW